MNAGVSALSQSALRISKMYRRRTSGCTKVSGQTAAISSSCVTRRRGCSTRYLSTAKGLGVKRMRRSSRQRHWLTMSRRNGGNLITDLLCGSVLTQTWDRLGVDDHAVQPFRRSSDVHIRQAFSASVAQSEGPSYSSVRSDSSLFAAVVVISRE